jgi:hypothetical protein
MSMAWTSVSSAFGGGDLDAEHGGVFGGLAGVAGDEGDPVGHWCFSFRLWVL